MSGDVLAFLGVSLGAVIALWTGMRSTAAQQISSLGGRVDAAGKELEECKRDIDALRRRNRALWEYVTRVRFDYLSRGEEPPALPDDLAEES